MTNEHQQPFAENQPRSTNDKKLVAKVLGEQTAEEMEELAGKPPSIETTPEPAAELTMSKTEAAATKAIEQRVVTPEQRRLEYIQWADSINRKEEWVDVNFIFLPNGNVEAVENFSLGDTIVNTFPPSLKKVTGLFEISFTNWKIPLDFLKNIEIEELSIDFSMVQDFPMGVICDEIYINHHDNLPVEQIDIAISSLEDKGYTNICAIKY